MASKEEIMMTLTPLTLNFPDFNSLSPDLRKAKMELFASQLADLQIPGLALAIKAILNGPGQWFPKIGEIRAEAAKQQAEYDRQQRLRREIATHPEWYTERPVLPPPVSRDVPAGRAVLMFANAIGKGL